MGFGIEALVHAVYIWASMLPVRKRRCAALIRCGGVDVTKGAGGGFIETDDYSERLREGLLSIDRRSISLTRFSESEQQEDLVSPPNCEGFGRVHIFEEEAFGDWPSNPLPIRPVARALHLGDRNSLAAQVFQNSGCNWRCWYCYVPFRDLTGRNGTMVSVPQMVEWTLAANPGRHMVDLSGGQPDLTPEWSLWFLQELDARGAEHVYVWSDDNLSTDYLWRYLNPGEVDYLGAHPRYGRACCIKGFDAESFSFNTHARPEVFDRQFELLRRLRETTRIDYYVYLTITCASTADLGEKMRAFFDRLQGIHEYLPLRCVPLKILEWGPVTPRMNPARAAALTNQYAAVDAWLNELNRRLPGSAGPIAEVPR